MYQYVYNNWVSGRIKSKSCLDVDFEYLNWYTHTFRRPLLQKNKSQNFLTIGAAPRCWLPVTGLDCWIVGWLSLQQRTMTTVCLYMGEQKMHAQSPCTTWYLKSMITFVCGVLPTTLQWESVRCFKRFDMDTSNVLFRKARIAANLVVSIERLITPDFTKLQP